MKLHKYKKALLILVSAAVLLTAFLYWQNNGLSTTKIIYSNPKIPDAFDGFVITQLSDLHNKAFGQGQRRLLKAIAKTAPDLIVITGDMIDTNEPDIPAVTELMDGAVKIAPVYFVSGNHEIWSGIYPEFQKRLFDAGIVVLDNQKTSLKAGNASIHLLGLADPDTISDFMLLETHKQIKAHLDALMSHSGDSFSILLSHRPELFDLYADQGIDLVFAGHAHGGQIRLPLIGGLFAPDQGYLPKYTAGSYEKGGTTMVVSRGLGNSVFPQRLFNRPEIVTVTLGRPAMTWSHKI